MCLSSSQPASGFCLPRDVASAGCGAVALFDACLNAGAFVARATAWTASFVDRVLNADPSGIVAEDYSAWMMASNPWNFTQCPDPTVRVGDQCLVTWLTTLNPSWLSLSR